MREFWVFSFATGPARRQRWLLAALFRKRKWKR